MLKKVAVTSTYRGNDYSYITGYLKENGFNAMWIPIETGSSEEIIEKLDGYHAIVAGGENWDKAALTELSDTLKIIARYGVGCDHVDIETATRLGIAVTNTPGTLSSSVAEAALILILNLTRKTYLFDSKLKAGEWWDKHTGIELKEKTVGLLGFGGIAKCLAKYLQPFSCRILAYDLYFDLKTAMELSVEYASIDKIASESDFVSIHLPLANETQGLVDEKFLSKMRNTAYLINTSRGGIINESDLIAALQKKMIAGAGLDVFEKEPADTGNPLLKMENVVLTPHIAANTYETIKATGKCASDNVIALFDGKTPPNILNPDYIKYLNELFGS